MAWKKLVRLAKSLFFLMVLLAACQPGTAPTQILPAASEPSATLGMPTSTLVRPTFTPVLPTFTSPPPTFTPQKPTPTPFSEFTLNTDTNQVFYGTANPLSALNGSQPVPFPEGYEVNTDTVGVGVLRGSASVGACTIYVFRSTTLKKAACQPGTYAGSNVSCVEEGSALYNQCSGHIVITPSGVAEHKYTTLSVTYLPEQQITLYMALDGAVDVRPMSRLGDYSTVGEPLRLESGQFLYTAPDDHVTQIGGIPMRAIQPLDRISPLITELDLMPWFLQTQSALDKLKIPIRLPSDNSSPITPGPPRPITPTP